MEDIICRVVEVGLISLYINSPLDLYRIVFWLLLMILLQLSVSLMEGNSVEKKITSKEIICLALFCLYLIGGIVFSFIVYYFWIFLIAFLGISGLIVVRFSPPFSLEKKGSGGILRILLEGWFWIIVHTLAITNSPKFVGIEYLPIFLVYEAWYLIKELENSKIDIQKKYITTGILMGRHGCYRMFLLLHLFSWIYIGLDMNFGYIRGLPLILFPWSLWQIKMVKSFKLERLKYQAFLYYLFFSGLTGISLIYKI
jgi:hypothetical protein